MSGFDLSELLPFYLDETDEHIAALNDALLRLEQDSTDVKALAEAFRMFHSIKGTSLVMGFEPVSRLTHHLESLFDQFRVKKRTLDRPVLDLTFRCLDELREYHRELRAEGQGTADLAALTPLVIATALETTSPVPHPQPAARTRASGFVLLPCCECRGGCSTRGSGRAARRCAGRRVRGTRADRRDGGLRAEPAAA